MRQIRRMQRWTAALGAAALAWAVFGTVVRAQTPAATKKASPSAAKSNAQVERGKHLVKIMGCTQCHTPMVFDEASGLMVLDTSRLMGGHPAGAAGPESTLTNGDQMIVGPSFTSFRLAFGTVYASNLTPEPGAGLGAWTESEFIQTMRTGRRQGVGRRILPPMPMAGLAALDDGDLRALFAYLRSLPPVPNKVPEPDATPEALAAFSLAVDERAERKAAPPPEKPKAP